MVRTAIVSLFQFQVQNFWQNISKEYLILKDFVRQHNKHDFWLFTLTEQRLKVGGTVIIIRCYHLKNDNNSYHLKWGDDYLKLFALFFCRGDFLTQEGVNE